MNKAQQRLEEIERLIKYHPKGCNLRGLLLEKQGILVGLEEGRKEVFDRIKKLQDVTNPCMECGSVQCAICWEDIENLKKEMEEK